MANLRERLDALADKAEFRSDYWLARAAARETLEHFDKAYDEGDLSVPELVAAMLAELSEER